MNFSSSLILTCLLCVRSLALDTYIVHVELPDITTSSIPTYDLDNWYNSFLPKSTSDSGQSATMVYSYKSVFKGFAARLSPEHVLAMEKIPGFISATPEEVLSLHTTHTPNFLGLQQNMGFWEQSNYGKGVIIGVLDSGIKPDHPSFSDQGMPSPPSKWKGKCEFNSTSCNNKLIGARVFQYGDGTPMDTSGHGTHTASTAAGNYVKGANMLGNANGTASGIAPLAHLAMYKVCTGVSCSESDILAAMDSAIEDGVDILSLSLGGSSRPFFSDNIALGAYSAVGKGIFVSCSAGNQGPVGESLSNEAPWILTVGASTVDRKFVANAVLGNKVELKGESLYQPTNFSSTQYPIIYPGLRNRNYNDRYCMDGMLSNATEFQGKIMVCESGGATTDVEKGVYVKSVGGVGMMIINDVIYGNTNLAYPHVLPATQLTYVDGQKLVAYMNSTDRPTASLTFKGTVIGDDQAPEVAFFSSRGPSKASPGILKPDIIGPGVNILAAWPLSVENINNTKSTFNIISGTSMSCPHLSGIAALIKSAHPDWSPAAIKSAIMTTADIVNLAKNPIQDEKLIPADSFAVGSGHVNPSRASNPGLIYDIQHEDYAPYLCGLNYTSQDVGKIVQHKVKCSAFTSISEAQLNYPSFSIQFGSKVQTFTRTVTNVGDPDSVYDVNIVSPAGVNVTVNPNRLQFSQQSQELTYEVTFIKDDNAQKITFSQGSITWVSGKTSVRSPIVAIMNI